MASFEDDCQERGPNDSARALLLDTSMLYDHDDWFSEQDDARTDFEVEAMADGEFVITYRAEGQVHRLLVFLPETGSPLTLAQ